MRGEKIDVLDHGFVRLIDYMGSDLSIVRAARVSYDADWRAGENERSDDRLIRYLMNNRHTTPFEAVTLTFEVKAPIFVFRQWHRHRTHSYNEVSARYTELPDEFYVPQPEQIGAQSSSSKQARVLTDLTQDEVAARRQEIAHYQDQCALSFAHYKALLQKGWPRELARMCLPVSTYSRMFDTVDLHNLFHFLELRLHAHAQYEIRVYAEAMASFVKGCFPVAFAAFEEKRRAVG